MCGSRGSRVRFVLLFLILVMSALHSESTDLSPAKIMKKVRSSTYLKSVPTKFLNSTPDVPGNIHGLSSLLDNSVDATAGVDAIKWISKEG